MKKINLIVALLIINITVFAQFNKGTKVLIDYQGQWYSGKILEVKGNNTFLVSYDDYDASWNEEVASGRLKLNEINGNVQKSPSKQTQTSSKATAVSGESMAAEMCGCLKKMMKTQKQEDRSKCLSMQEEHVYALGKGSAEYGIYQKLVGQCEKEITNAKNNAGSNSENAPRTFEEKVKAVCNCFNEVNQGKNQKFNCFKMQSDLGATLGDRKAEFNLETNKCDK
ncbi:MAG: hypothetical protein JNJ41_01345 [Bacteroidia bacterium]|nr:hypothetical protein [Bacteroidia bacterium]